MQTLKATWLHTGDLHTDVHTDGSTLMTHRSSPAYKRSHFSRPLTTAAFQHCSKFQGKLPPACRPRAGAAGQQPPISRELPLLVHCPSPPPRQALPYLLVVLWLLLTPNPTPLLPAALCILLGSRSQGHSSRAMSICTSALTMA